MARRPKRRKAARKVAPRKRKRAAKPKPKKRSSAKPKSKKRSVAAKAAWRKRKARARIIEILQEKGWETDIPTSSELYDHLSDLGEKLGYETSEMYRMYYHSYGHDTP